MPKIFLSYRRDDSEHITGRIDDRLAAHFGRESVFVDIDTIPFGVDFREHLQQAVTQCDLLLAIIGEGWTDARFKEGPRAGQQRLADPHDFVRIEIESAMQRGIMVIPVLVGKGTMPGPDQLPESLRELAYRNAAEVGSGRDFHDHVDRLIRSIERFAADLEQQRARDAEAEESRRQAETEARKQAEHQRLEEQREVERRQAAAEHEKLRQAEKQRVADEAARQREAAERERVQLQTEGEQALALFVRTLLDRTDGKFSPPEERELELFRQRYQLSEVRCRPLIAAIRDVWQEERQLEAQARAKSEEEAARQARERAVAAQENLKRLQIDGRLEAWVESHLGSQNPRDWWHLLAELRASEFWPLPLPELQSLLSALRKSRTEPLFTAAASLVQSGEPFDPAAPVLALSIPGVWYSRAIHREQDDWEYEALLPGLVSTMPEREYMLGITPDVGDKELALLPAFRAIAPLRALHLEWSDLITDAGLKQVEQLVSLHSLDLHIGEQITGAGLAHLASLTELQSLTLHHCASLQDASLALLTPLKNLRSLTLGECRQVTDSGLRFLASLTELRSLALWGARGITDAGLESLAALPHLETLTLCHAPGVSVGGLAGLSSLKALKVLNVYRCCQVRSPDMVPLRRDLPRCRLTLISANRDDERERRKQHLEEVRVQVQRIRSSQRTRQPPPASAVPKPPASNVPPKRVPVNEQKPPAEPEKKWWEVWK